MSATLKHQREMVNLSQADLARMLHLTKQTVYKWESGMTPVSPKHWARYAQALNISPDAFEDVLIETLKAYAIENSDPEVFDTAIKSRRYSAEKTNAAKQAINAIFKHSQSQPNNGDLDEITRDIAKKIHARAVARAEMRKGVLLEKLFAEIRKVYENFDDAQCRALVAELNADSVGPAMIKAELERMTRHVAFLAEDAENAGGAEQ